MVMVDRIAGIDGAVTITTFLVAADNVFVEDGFFREPGLIENMAQSAAAGAGAKPGLEGKPAPVGFIGGIRNLKIDALPPAGSELTTKITVQHEVFNATIVQGEVFLNDRCIASCELKIFIINS